MKKLTLALVVIAVVALSSCHSAKKCPAYSQVESSSVENVG